MKLRPIVATLLLSFIPLLVLATEDRPKEKSSVVIQANVVTGFNRLQGVPLWNLSFGLGAFGFDTVGAHQQQSSTSVPLAPWMANDTVLGTYVDPTFLGLYGLTPDVVPAEQLNLPLNDVPVVLGPSGEEQAALPFIKEADILDYSRATPKSDITLGDWLSASGKAKLVCRKRSSEVSIVMKNLIPNGLYTITGVFMSPEGPVAIPLGGVPNAVTANSRGRASFKRDLNFCFNNNESLGQLMIIDVTWHSNHTLYGTQTNLPFAGSFAGVVNHIHLSFLVEGEPL
jgi:hypothetical protein